MNHEARTTLKEIAKQLSIETGLRVHPIENYDSVDDETALLVAKLDSQTREWLRLGKAEEIPIASFRNGGMRTDEDKELFLCAFTDEDLDGKPRLRLFAVGKHAAKLYLTFVEKDDPEPLVSKRVQ